MLTILFLGDIVGEPGRSAVIARLPELKEKYALDFTIVNGENAAGGRGITGKSRSIFCALAFRSLPPAIISGTRKRFSDLSTPSRVCCARLITLQARPGTARSCWKQRKEKWA